MNYLYGEDVIRFALIGDVYRVTLFSGNDEYVGTTDFDNFCMAQLPSVDAVREMLDYTIDDDTWKLIIHNGTAILTIQISPRCTYEIRMKHKQDELTILRQELTLLRNEFNEQKKQEVTHVYFYSGIDKSMVTPKEQYYAQPQITFECKELERAFYDHFDNEQMAESRGVLSCHLLREYIMEETDKGAFIGTWNSQRIKLISAKYQTARPRYQKDKHFRLIYKSLGIQHIIEFINNQGYYIVDYMGDIIHMPSIVTNLRNSGQPYEFHYDTNGGCMGCYNLRLGLLKTNTKKIHQKFIAQGGGPAPRYSQESMIAHLKHSKGIITHWNGTKQLQLAGYIV